MASTEQTGDGEPRAPSATSTAATGQAGAEHLTPGVIWAFSFPAIAFGIMTMLFGTYRMKFATDVLLIAPAVMGSIIAGRGCGTRSPTRWWDTSRTAGARALVAVAPGCSVLPFPCHSL